MATVYMVSGNSDAEDLVKSFLSYDDAMSLAKALNEDEDNYIGDEKIKYYGVLEGDYKREEFYKEYYDSFLFEEEEYPESVFEN